MHKHTRSILSLCILAFGMLTAAWKAMAQDASLCGSAPPVADERLAGDIKGRAELITKFLGGVELAGKIETSRTEIFSKYPDAESSRLNAYYQFQVCVLLMTDKSMTTTQKLNFLRDIQREFAKPVVKSTKVSLYCQITKPYDDQIWVDFDDSDRSFIIKNGETRIPTRRISAFVDTTYTIERNDTSRLSWCEQAVGNQTSLCYVINRISGRISVEEGLPGKREVLTGGKCEKYEPKPTATKF